MDDRTGHARPASQQQGQPLPLQREKDLGHRHAFWIVRSALFAKRTTISHDKVPKRVSHWVLFRALFNYLTLYSSEIDVSLANDPSSWNNTQQESNSGIEEMNMFLRDKVSLEFHMTGHDLQSLQMSIMNWLHDMKIKLHRKRNAVNNHSFSYHKKLWTNNYHANCCNWR